MGKATQKYRNQLQAAVKLEQAGRELRSEYRARLYLALIEKYGGKIVHRHTRRIHRALETLEKEAGRSV